MNNYIAHAANTVVPALLAIESLGFAVEIGERYTAWRDHDRYQAEDPVAPLGLIRLVEIRSWEWVATDQEIDNAMRRFALG